MNQIDLKKPASIEENIARWAAEQAALLRAGRFEHLDVENLAEEVEDLGRSGKYEIDSRMEILLQHQNRDAIANIIEESPSLRPFPATVVERAYRSAPLEGSGETRLPLSTFPETCPYTIEQILDPDFLPGK